MMMMHRNETTGRILVLVPSIEYHEYNHHQQQQEEQERRQKQRESAITAACLSSSRRRRCMLNTTKPIRWSSIQQEQQQEHHYLNHHGELVDSTINCTDNISGDKSHWRRQKSFSSLIDSFRNVRTKRRRFFCEQCNNTKKQRRKPLFLYGCSINLLLLLLFVCFCFFGHQQPDRLLASLFVLGRTTTTPSSTTRLSSQQSMKVLRKNPIIKKPETKKTITTTNSNSNNNYNNKNSRAWVNGIKNGLCSAGAAACSKTLLQPIDAIKTMQQYYQTKTNKQQLSLTVWGACREIMNRPNGVGVVGSGIGNFYSGLVINVIGAIPSVALYFGVYSYCKERLLRTKYGTTNPMICIATSAAIGNTIASFSRVPYEVLKQQLQTGLYPSTFHALQAVLTTRGMFWDMIFPKGGIAIQMIRDVPYAIVTLLVYESLQTKFNTCKPAPNGISTASDDDTKGRRKPKKGMKSSSTPTTTTKKNKVLDFMLGGIAGGIGSYVTNPMDVVKTRLQTNSILYNGSVILCAKQVWKEGGIPAFLRGSIPRLIHKVPANAFFFLFYELFRKLLNVE